jgi:hypothetical protein
MPIQLKLIDFVKQLEKQDQSGAEPLDSGESSRASETLDHGFERDVNRAVHSALIIRPIFELEARRFGQSDSDDTSNIWGGVDVLWIAFAILDVISELTEYQPGVTRSEVLEKILPQAHRQVAACGIEATEEGLTDILNKVFDHLVNRQNRYLPFHYTWFDGATSRHRTRRFWLVKTIYTGEGREALFTLTDEGYAAYFGLHETSALDAAAIGNLRIKLLIERGNIEDAISVADSNRKQCARKALEVRNTRRQIRRNIHGVDFDHIQTLAKEGLNQAEEIQKEGRRLHNMVIENLSAACGDRREAKLHRLAERLEQLNNQLVKLTGELQQLPDDYHYHSFKLFRRRTLGAFPPMEEVMRRLCLLVEADAAAVGTEFIARLDPPPQRPLFDPAALIEACDRALERRNVPGDRRHSVHEIDARPAKGFVPDLDEEQMRAAFETLHDAVTREKEVLLSHLLEEVSKRSGSPGKDPLFPAAIAMALFQCLVERRLALRHRLKVERPDPHRRVSVALCAGRRYRGHELRMIRQLPARR